MPVLPDLLCKPTDNCKLNLWIFAYKLIKYCRKVEKNLVRFYAITYFRSWRLKSYFQLLIFLLFQLSYFFFNPFQGIDFFLYALKASENQRFSDVFSGYRKRPVAWNGLKIPVILSLQEMFHSKITLMLSERNLFNLC